MKNYYTPSLVQGCVSLVGELEELKEISAVLLAVHGSIHGSAMSVCIINVTALHCPLGSVFGLPIQANCI